MSSPKDLEEVIAAVEACDDEYFVNCTICPYYEDKRCKQRLQNDILTYLRMAKDDGVVRPGVQKITRGMVERAVTADYYSKHYKEKMVRDA